MNIKEKVRNLFDADLIVRYKKGIKSIPEKGNLILSYNKEKEIIDIKHYIDIIKKGSIVISKKGIGIVLRKNNKGILVKNKNKKYFIEYKNVLRINKI